MTTLFTGSILAASLLALSAVGCGGADNPGAATGTSSAAVTQSGESFRGRHGRMAARFDANGDGTLQVSELPERARERLVAADANRDGVLADDELRAHFVAMRARGPGEGRGMHRGMHRGRHAPDPARMIQRLDANGDGALQITELPERMRERVSAGDANRDGVLSVEEIRAGMERFRAEHPRGPMGAPPAAPEANPSAE